MAKQELTDMQKAFAEAYHECGNATQSAVVAGYSADTASSQGSRLLNNVKVKKYLDKLRKDEGVEYDMELDMVIEELTLIIQDRKVKPHYRLEAIDKLATLKGWKKADTKIEIHNNTHAVDSISDEELEKRMATMLGANTPLKRIK